MGSTPEENPAAVFVDDEEVVFTNGGCCRRRCRKPEKSPLVSSKLRAVDVSLVPSFSSLGRKRGLGDESGKGKDPARKEEVAMPASARSCGQGSEWMTGF